MDDLQEQFKQTLRKLVETAKAKKNFLTYKEVNDAIAGLQLNEEKMDLIICRK